MGPASLEEGKKKVEDSANILENIKTFHSTVVPFIEVSPTPCIICDNLANPAWNFVCCINVWRKISHAKHVNYRNHPAKHSGSIFLFRKFPFRIWKFEILPATYKILETLLWKMKKKSNVEISALFYCLNNSGKTNRPKCIYKIEDVNFKETNGRNKN